VAKPLSAAARTSTLPHGNAPFSKTSAAALSAAHASLPSEPETRHWTIADGWKLSARPRYR